MQIMHIVCTNHTNSMYKKKVSCTIPYTRYIGILREGNKKRT